MALNDAHCHFFSPVFFDRLMDELVRASRGAAAGRRTPVPQVLAWEDPGSPDELADRWVAELDRHGVTRAVLIASVPGDEASVASAVSRHPSRLVGACMLNAAAPDAPDRAALALGDLGLRMVCLFPAMHHFRLDDESVGEVFELAKAHRGAIFAHCGVLTIGVRRKLGLPSPFDLRLGDPLALAVMASRYPEVPVIVPHFGAGFLREALMAAEACPNIHLDTSSSNGWIKYYPGLTLIDVFRRALDTLGPDRLLFGTDSSFFPRGWQQPIYEAQKSLLDTIGADAAVQTKIFGGNFERIFPSSSRPLASSQ